MCSLTHSIKETYRWVERLVISLYDFPLGKYDGKKITYTISTISKSVRSYLLFNYKDCKSYSLFRYGSTCRVEDVPEGLNLFKLQASSISNTRSKISFKSEVICTKERAFERPVLLYGEREAQVHEYKEPAFQRYFVWIHCTAQSGCLDSYIRWRTCKTHDKPREAVKKRYTRGSPNGGTQYCKSVLPAKQEDTQRIEIS